MPEIKYYVVTETRRVEVTANDAVDAARLASAAFEHGQFETDAGIAAGKAPEGIWGNTTSKVERIALQVETTR